jgi:AraC-like DNA-binding protein
MHKEFVPLSQAISVLKVVEAQGYNIQELLQSIGLDFNPLESSDIEFQTIPAEHYNRLYNSVIWLLQDESFGLNMKQKIPAGSFRMMCMCIIHCSNLEQAIIRASEFTAFCRNLAGLAPMLVTPISYEPNGVVVNHLPGDKEMVSSEDAHQAISAAHILHMWRRFCSWLIGKNIELLEVCFQSPQPVNSKRLEELFNCPLSFDQPFNGFKFSESYLKAPLIHTEDTLRAFLRAAPYQLTSLYNEDDGGLLFKMRAVVGLDIGKGFPSVTDLADELNMSVRTLRRRLKAEGTTYQQFKDNLRREAAMGYLNRPELKINAVSALLGFDEPSAFHRSFKKWTGLTPGEYRQQMDI